MRHLILLLATSSLIHETAVADCIDDAAAHHGVNAYVLRAIGWQESRLNPRALHRNANGTTDLGAFQINSIHLPTLRSAGITPQALRDGCVSAYVAAWHYRRQIERHGNTWSAVGSYHSSSPTLNHAYANDIAWTLMSWGILNKSTLPFPASAAPSLSLPAPSPSRDRVGIASAASDAEVHVTKGDTLVFDASGAPVALEIEPGIARR